MLSVYSQVYPLNIHPSCLNEESSKAETGCISKIDHGLGEGEGKTIDVALFLGAPVQRVRERWHQTGHLSDLIQIHFMFVHISHEDDGSVVKVMPFLILVWHFQVFLIQRLKLGFSVERDNSTDILDGLCSNL